MHEVALRQIAEAFGALAQRKDDKISPPTWTVPVEGNSPDNARSSVVFPAPLGPTSATNCRLGKESDTARSTARPDSVTPRLFVLSRT